MPKEGHIPFEELNVDFGYSTFEGSLFLYTDEENQFRKEFRKFVKREVEPVADRIDREDNFELIHEILKKMGKEGYFSLAFPQEIGGGGKGLVYRTIMGEELTAISYSTAVTYGASAALYAMPIIKFGKKEQHEKFLKPIMHGEKLGAIAMTEPGAGCDVVGGMRCTAKKSGDGYVINGEKRFITNGSKANFLLLYVKTNLDVKPNEGISAFIFPTDTKGYEVVKDYELMGRRGSKNSHLAFNDCWVPEICLLGEENKGFNILMSGLDGERVFATSQYMGIARSAFEIALKYAAERMQFRRAIREFEGVSFKLAEMYAHLEAARLLDLRAARMIDANRRATKEAAIAKFLTADAAVKICAEALQILGGIGYTKEYPIERYFRDVKIGQISAGSSEIMKFLTQRELFREIGV
ncbi:MAG: acyl-CoA dehydrogenase family protein [Candidatus Jordarchaeum sp.]|uniref:acyl-CoA dehydrogenase family protein n=1 Tax=Candidatus Jordarchaeum sp. TaxID=2823881 RepID=UPI00404B7DA7